MAAPAQAADPAYVVSHTIDLDHPVGDGIAVDSTRHKAYVTHPDHDLVSVVDLTTNTVTGTIAVGDFPFRVAVDEVTGRAYVGNTGSHTVSEIDTTTDTVVRTIGGFPEPRGLAVDPTTHKVYVANFGWSENVAVVDPTTDPATVTGTGFVGGRPWAVDVDPTTHRAYVSTLFGDHVGTVEGTGVVDGIGWFDGPTQVTVDPIDRVVYVVATNTRTLHGIDVSGPDQAASAIDLPLSHPTDVAVDQASGTLFVSDMGDDTVSVVDRESMTETTTVDVGARPTAIDIDTGTSRVYTLNQGTAGDASLSVVQAPVAQAITFTSTAPTDAEVGDTYQAVATGGGSGRPVTFSTTSEACTVSPTGTVSLEHAGSCVIAADQAAGAEYLAAPTATQTVPVALAPTTIELELLEDDLEWGTLTFAQTWSSVVPGTVQYYVDGEALGGPQQVESPNGYTTLPNEIGSTALGLHEVEAVLTPTDPTKHAGSSDTAQFTVSRIPTRTQLTVAPDSLSAAVTRLNPGFVHPTGLVRFFVAGEPVGSAPLVDGEATLPHDLAAGDARRVTAVFRNQSHFARSTDATARANPVITATRSSASAKRNGWHRDPVTITFRCRVAGAPLTEPCPSPVTLSRSGANQSVTRTVMAQDGGVDTVTVDDVDIDRVAPRLRLTGVRAGATYFAGGPRAHCRATDAHSGPAGCTVTRATRGNRLVYTARAKDRAGNVTTRRVVARSASVWVDGARQRDGQPVVRAGRTYTLLVAAKRRPSYVYAAPAPHRPYGGDVPFRRAGANRWALGVTFDTSMARHAVWNIGTRVGSHLTVTKVRVVR